MAYDDWKLATPPESGEQHSAGCDGVHDDSAGDRRCTVCAEQFDDSGDDDYAWEREPLCNLVDEEIEPC